MKIGSVQRGMYSVVRASLPMRVCVVAGRKVFVSVLMRDFLGTSSEKLADFMRCQIRDDLLSRLKFIADIFKMVGIHDTHHHFFIDR